MSEPTFLRILSSLSDYLVVTGTHGKAIKGQRALDWPIMMQFEAQNYSPVSKNYIWIIDLVDWVFSGYPLLSEILKQTSTR